MTILECEDITPPKRHWWQASRSQVYVRMMQLEAELSCAAVLLELREKSAEERGERRSVMVAELAAKWAKLIAEQPTAERNAA